MKSYRVFSRTCKDWKSFASAQKKTIRRNLTYEEALHMCKEFNENRNSSQISRGMKYEFEKE